jgi:hypothetical protein
MAKASRARMRMAATAHPPVRAIRETTFITKDQRSNGISFDLRATVAADLLHLIQRAERCGVRAARIAAWRESLQRTSASLQTLGECERRLRAWLSRKDSLFYR